MEKQGKSLLILSPSAEKTTNDVIEWLLYRNIKFCRLSEINNHEVELISINDFTIRKYNKSFCNTNISSFWCRKGELKLLVSTKINNQEIDKKITNYLSTEWKVLSDFLIQKLEEKKHLGNFFLQTPNKLNHLYLAQQSGLIIPKTTISNNSDQVKELKNKLSSIINKSLRDSFTGTFYDISYYNHTERVTNEVIEKLDKTFFPSLFQEELCKAFELRIVFVNDVLWSMAIFSQNDEKTQVDWRNYNYKKPNRKTPFKLPETVAKNIRKFITASGLNTGAIDMVVTKDNQYVFLECNPNGQISMVSEHCNYFIERHIAEYLSIY